MHLLDRAVRALETGLVDARRTRARRDLLNRGERFLADNGFSRELLERGNDAWPWRVDGTVPRTAPGLLLPSAGLRTPVPAAPRDAVSHEFGIARADVVDAVRRDPAVPDGPTHGTDERMAA